MPLNDILSARETANYVAQHKAAIEEAFGLALNSAISMRAPDPVAYIAKQMKPSLSMADADKDGMLSVQDLQSLFLKAGVEWPEERVAAFLGALDVNGDGKVEEDEFIRSLLELRNVMDAVLPVAKEKQKNHSQEALAHPEAAS